MQPSNSLKTSGPQAPVLPATGLITSGPITSGPLSSTGAPRKAGGAVSGPQEVLGSAVLTSTGSTKVESGRVLLGSSGGASLAINSLSNSQEYSFRKNFPRVILWTLTPLFVIGFIAGAFIFAAVKNAILLFVVAGLFGVVVLVLAWNTYWGKRSIFGFMAKHPHSDLAAAKDGQLVKVTGVSDSYFLDAMAYLAHMCDIGAIISTSCSCFLFSQCRCPITRRRLIVITKFDLGVVVPLNFLVV